MTATARRPGSTRERLLEVALDLFAEEGFGGTTITEVERRAGLTPGTGSFYRHFRSKEELLEAAVHREVDRCMAAVSAAREAAPAVDDPVQRRVQELGLLLDDIRRFQRLFRLLLTEGDRVPEIRQVITTALEGPGRSLSWRENPELVVRIAALTGFHLLSTWRDAAVEDVPEEEFLEAIAALES